MISNATWNKPSQFLTTDFLGEPPWNFHEVLRASRETNSPAFFAAHQNRRNRHNEQGRRVAPGGAAWYQPVSNNFWQHIRVNFTQTLLAYDTAYFLEHLSENETILIAWIAIHLRRCDPFRIASSRASWRRFQLCKRKRSLPWFNTRTQLWRNCTPDAVGLVASLVCVPLPEALPPTRLIPRLPDADAWHSKGSPGVRWRTLQKKQNRRNSEPNSFSQIHVHFCWQELFIFQRFESQDVLLFKSWFSAWSCLLIPMREIKSSWSFCKLDPGAECSLSSLSPSTESLLLKSVKEASNSVRVKLSFRFASASNMALSYSFSNSSSTNDDVSMNESPVSSADDGQLSPSDVVLHWITGSLSTHKFLGKFSHWSLSSMMNSFVLCGAPGIPKNNLSPLGLRLLRRGDVEVLSTLFKFVSGFRGKDWGGLIASGCLWSRKSSMHHFLCLALLLFLHFIFPPTFETAEQCSFDDESTSIVSKNGLFSEKFTVSLLVSNITLFTTNSWRTWSLANEILFRVYLIFLQKLSSRPIESVSGWRMENVLATKCHVTFEFRNSNVASGVTHSR